MYKDELISILEKMNCKEYLCTLYQLKKVNKQFNFIIDFDSIRFTHSNYILQLSDIANILVEDDVLYILTKKENYLHRINSSTEKHQIFDANYTTWLKIKKFFRIKTSLIFKYLHLCNVQKIRW